MTKASGIGNQIPVPRKPHQSLHGAKIDITGSQNGVRWLGVKDQLKGLGMANNGGAAQAF